MREILVVLGLMLVGCGAAPEGEDAVAEASGAALTGSGNCVYMGKFPQLSDSGIQATVMVNGQPAAHALTKISDPAGGRRLYVLLVNPLQASDVIEIDVADGAGTVTTPSSQSLLCD